MEIRIWRIITYTVAPRSKIANWRHCSYHCLQYCCYTRLLQRRFISSPGNDTVLDRSAAESSRRRQPKMGCAAAAKKNRRAAEPAAAAAVNFSTGHGGPNNSHEWVCNRAVKQANFIAESAGERILKIGQYLVKLRTRVGLCCIPFWLFGYIE